MQEKITLTHTISTNMTSNPHFVTPHPTPEAIQLAGNDLEDAENIAQVARQDAKAKTTIRNNKEDELVGSLVRR